MAATYGKVKAFNPAVDDWAIYEEKLQFYFSANGITKTIRKRSILLTVCGDSTYKLLKSLVPNGKLDAEGVTYTSLVKLLQAHYTPRRRMLLSTGTTSTPAAGNQMSPFRNTLLHSETSHSTVSSAVGSCWRKCRGTDSYMVLITRVSRENSSLKLS